jgi:hypothetical protein
MKPQMISRDPVAVELDDRVRDLDLAQLMSSSHAAGRCIEQRGRVHEQAPDHKGGHASRQPGQSAARHAAAASGDELLTGPEGRPDAGREIAGCRGCDGWFTGSLLLLHFRVLNKL